MNLVVNSMPLPAWPAGMTEGCTDGDAAWPVLLYGEADLQPVAYHGPAPVPWLVNELRAAGTPQERERVVRAQLQAMGFEWLAYCTVPQPLQGVHRQACLRTYANAAWLESYFSHGYQAIDPRQMEPARSSLPLVWDVGDLEEGLAGHPAPARARRFIQDLAGSGIRSGIFLRILVPAAQAGGHAVVSLQSAEPDRRWISETLLGEALAFGLSLHDFLSRHVSGPASPGLQARHVPGPAGTGLSAMQQEVLGLVVHGLTDKQIADRLGVSAHTVDYHLRQLRHRFAVRNRVQLVNATEHLFASS